MISFHRTGSTYKFCKWTHFDNSAMGLSCNLVYFMPHWFQKHLLSEQTHTGLSCSGYAHLFGTKFHGTIKLNSNYTYSCGHSTEQQQTTDKNTSSSNRKKPNNTANSFEGERPPSRALAYRRDPLCASFTAVGSLKSVIMYPTRNHVSLNRLPP